MTLRKMLPLLVTLLLGACAPTAQLMPSPASSSPDTIRPAKRPPTCNQLKITLANLGFDLQLLTTNVHILRAFLASKQYDAAFTNFGPVVKSSRHVQTDTQRFDATALRTWPTYVATDAATIEQDVQTLVADEASLKSDRSNASLWKTALTDVTTMENTGSTAQGLRSHAYRAGGC